MPRSVRRPSRRRGSRCAEVLGAPGSSAAVVGSPMGGILGLVRSPLRVCEGLPPRSGNLLTPWGISPRKPPLESNSISVVLLSGDDDSKTGASYCHPMEEVLT